MGEAIRRLERRSQAKKKLAQLMSNSDRVVTIHYSCEDFHDRPDGSSPRITSIAVRNLDSGQTKSFSIHLMAEKKGYTKEQTESNFNELEKLMLDKFYEFVRSHLDYDWLHWNMRDVHYGFQAIAHRYEVLDGQPVEIHDSKLVDLSRLLTAIYGLGYIQHPRLQSLSEKNNISMLNFLSGADEAVAFKGKEYVKLHTSTLRKVDVLANIAERANSNVLKTNAKGLELYKLYPQSIGEWTKEHWLASLISFIITIIGFLISLVVFK
jgi:hypothetical protein